MKIALITPTTLNISAFGVRSLSSYLKAKGHEVRLILLPTKPQYRRNSKGVLYGEFTYSNVIVEKIMALVSDCDLIGISFMTQHYVATVRLTRAIRDKLDIPVVWGGVHPSVKPDESLKHVDMVCVGEGEQALAELAWRMERGENYNDVANFYFREGERIIRNPVRPLIQNLDDLPWLDFGPENHFVHDLMSNSIMPFDDVLFERSLARVPYFNGRLLRSFMFSTTRGCPFSCSYCVNDFYRNLYGSHGFVRKMTVERIVGELEATLQRYPFIEEIEFCDDNFALRPVREIETFSKQYKERIGLPFQLLMSPKNIIEEKIAPLVDAGLVFVETGIQSAAEVSEQLYNRKLADISFFNAVRILQKYKDVMAPPCYHLILDNPFETIEDTLMTFELTLKLPRPFWFKRSSLVAFPGTKVYQRFLEAGLIQDEVSEIYNKILEMPSTTYINILYLLNSQNYPVWLLRLLSKRQLVEIFNRTAWVPFFGIAETGIRGGSKIMRWLKILARGDFKSIYQRLRMIGKVKGGWLSSRPPAF